MAYKRKWLCVHCHSEVNPGRKYCEDKPECQAAKKAVYADRQRARSKAAKGIPVFTRPKGKVKREVPIKMKRYCRYVPQGSNKPCGKPTGENFFFCKIHHEEVDDYGMETL